MIQQRNRDRDRDEKRTHEYVQRVLCAQNKMYKTHSMLPKSKRTERKECTQQRWWRRKEKKTIQNQSAQKSMKKKKTIKHKTSTRPKHLNGKWFGCFSHWQWPLRFFNVNRMATNNFYVRHVKRMASTNISQTGIELRARRERERKRESSKERRNKRSLAHTTPIECLNRTTTELPYKDKEPKSKKEISEFTPLT